MPCHLCRFQIQVEEYTIMAQFEQNYLDMHATQRSITQVCDDVPVILVLSHFCPLYILRHHFFKVIFNIICLAVPRLLS